MAPFWKMIGNMGVVEYGKDKSTTVTLKLMP